MSALPPRWEIPAWRKHRPRGRHRAESRAEERVKVAENEGVALLSLAAKKGRIAQDSAVGIKRQIESGVHGPAAGAKPISEMLVKDEHITATQADLLLSELAKAHGPKVIGRHQVVSRLADLGLARSTSSPGMERGTAARAPAAER